MRTQQINVYQYEELDEDAQQRALEESRKDNDTSFLKEDMTDAAKHLLEEQGYIVEDFNVFYSLNYSKGDGVCLTGRLTYKHEKGEDRLTLKHSGHYYHENSFDVFIEPYDYELEDGEELDVLEKEHEEDLREICKKLEKYGYEYIEYENGEENFKEVCDINEWEFTEDGERY